MPKISDPDVARILSQSKCDGSLLTLPGGPRLERALYTKVNDVLESLGGKWSRGQNGHVFAGDAAAAISAAIATGEYRCPKKDDAFFPTPPWLAKQMVKLAGVTRLMRVMEPSAGRGAIVHEISRAGGYINAIEINPDYKQDIIQAMASGGSCGGILIADFLATPVPAAEEAVVMNPPFSIAKKPVFIDHVMKAFDCLKPGGVLVSVTPTSWQFRTDAKHKKFRDWVLANGETFDIADGTFMEAGTAVKTVGVIVRQKQSASAAT